MQMVTSTNIKQSQTTRDTKYKQARRLTTIIVAAFIVLYWLFFNSVTQRSTLIKGNGAECVSASFIVECRDRLRCKVKKIASVTLSTGDAKTQFSAFINFLNEKLRDKRVV